MVVSSCSAARNAAESVRASRIAVSRDWASGMINDEYVHGRSSYRSVGTCGRRLIVYDNDVGSVGLSAALRRGACGRSCTGCPGVDQVGAEQRAAMLGTRSIKTTAKAWAIDLAIRMVDLTTLEGADTPGKVRALCAKALPARPGRPDLPARWPRSASTRRWSRWPPRRCAGSGVHIASVATAFPSGQAPLDVKLADTQAAVAAGADEIDMVINRGAFLAGRYLEVFEEIVAVKEACGDAHLKVILETGELATYDNVRRASWLAMLAGGDFIKTSTGKVPVGGDPAGDPGHAGGGPRLPRR